MKSGLFIGLNKGFIVQKPSTNTRKAKPSYKKGRLGISKILGIMWRTAIIGKRTKQIREIVREICGFTSYEKRMMEMIKVGTGAAAKKGLKFVKKRLGSMSRAKAKRDELDIAVQAIRHGVEHKEAGKKEETHKA